MSGLFRTYITEQLAILEEWDADALLSALDITSDEILSVPAFRDKAIQWIADNAP